MPTQQALERAFRRRGIAVRTATRATDVKNGSDCVTVTVDSGETLEADQLLVAVGRGPNTAGHGFEQVGIEIRNGFIVTDETLCTSVANVYAVGDVVAGLQLAHRGFQQGMFVAEHFAGLDPTPIDETAIPRVTYCDPEIASVGLTETAAAARYGEVHSVTYDLGGNGKSQILRTQGAIKLVQAGNRGDPGPILGIHMVGARVDRPHPQLRAELIGTQLIGLALRRYLLAIEPLAHTPADRLATAVGPVIQHYFTEPDLI